NQTSTAKQMSWFEYWDVAPVDQTAHTTRGVLTPIWEPGTTTLSVGQTGGHLADDAPLGIFAAVLRGPTDGFETSVEAFFGDGTRAAPAAVVADQLSDTLAPPSLAGSASGALLAFRAPMTVAPGESVTLRYVYGIAHSDAIPGLVAKYRAVTDPLGD